MTDETYFPTGAIVCTRQRKRGRGFVEWLMSLVSWLIARASRMPFEPKTRATHTALVIKGGTLETALILEALWPRVQIALLSKYAGHMTVYRPRRINTLICNLMATRAREQAKLTGGRTRGIVYGLLKLPLFLLDCLLSKMLCYVWIVICALVPGFGYRPFEVRLFTRINLIWIFVCSQVVARVYQEVGGVKFIYHWSRVTPDDIDDYCGAAIEEFEQIYP